jgi:hypothetical protein
MSDTYRQQIDAGLIENPGPCEHGCPFDGEGCLECRVEKLEKENKSLREDLSFIEDQLESGRDYLMSLDTNEVVVADVLDAFGFGRNGLAD